MKNPTSLLYFLLVLSILSLVKSQEDDGSILEVFESEDLTAAELEEMEDNVLTNEGLETDAEIDPVDTSRTETDASFGIYSEFEELNEVNSYLSFENSILDTSYSELEAELIDATSKINEYRYDYDITASELKEKIKTLDEYNHQLIREALMETEEETEDSGPDDDDEISQTTILGICLGLVFLLLLGTRTICGSSIHEVFTPALYTLFEGITILMIVTSVGCLAYYVDPFEDIEYKHVLAGIAIFTFVWLFFGVFLIALSQGFVYRWTKYEGNIKEVERELRSYEAVRSNLKKSINYYVMKKLFTSSPYLPLHLQLKQLDFSKYLSINLATNIKDLFHISWLGYLLVMLSIISWRVLIYYEMDLETEIMLAYPVFCVILLLVILLKLLYVHSQLVPSISAEQMQSIDPDELSTLPIPHYLQGYIPSFESNPSFCFCIKIHPLKISLSYLFQKNTPTRHDCLFWLDVYGIGFIKGILQGIAVTMCLWLTVEIFYYIPDFQPDLYSSALLYSSLMVWIATLFAFLPHALKHLSVVASIEMKKNNEIVQEVLTAQRIVKSQLMVRVYRQMKMIYRDTYMENKYQALTDFMEKFTDEIFFIHSAGTIGIDELEDLLAMCGIELNDDELRLFAKECMPVLNI